MGDVQVSDTGARRIRPTIVFADGDDQRVVAAGELLARDRAANPVLLGARSTPTSAVCDAKSAHHNSKKIDLDDPVQLAAMMLYAGEADASIAGATRPTSDVVRAALVCVGLAPGVRTASSCFLMRLPNTRQVIFADCGVVPEPTASQLADIAASSARTFRQLVNEPPIVALLSFSTLGSASHPSVDRVTDALRILRQDEPSLTVDGELQFDSAISAETAAVKAPNSEVAGRANVFVFPDLNSGNIGYKIAERIGGAVAAGPLLQGFGGVVHDLSRACSVDDIVAVSHIAAKQVLDAV